MGLSLKIVLPAIAGAAYTAGRAKRTSPSTAPGRPTGAKRMLSQAGKTTGAAGGVPAATHPGAHAETPAQIPAAGWKQILKRAWAETKDDNVPLLAAGIAYYSFLALFPALLAGVTLYGLFSDPSQVQDQITSLTKSLPQESAKLIGGQLKEIANGSSSALSIGLVVSLLGALFSASGGVGNLMKAINLAYDEKETRGFLKLRGTALLLTLGAIVFLVVAVGLVAVLPATLNHLGLGSAGKLAVSVLRWAGLVAFVLVALAVLYRYAPDRDNPKFAWVGLGSIVATLLWIIGSAAFSIYVSNFGKYGKTYGALAGVVVLLLWLYLTAYIVLLGAEINSETEAQTVRDTTKGPEQPMGERRAVKADTVVSS